MYELEKTIKKTRLNDLINKSSANIRKDRSALLSEMILSELEANKREKQNNLNSLKMKGISLMDFGRNDEHSLVVSNPDFNAKEWVKQYQELGEKIRVAEVQLDIANKAYEFFSGAPDENE